MNNDFCQSLSAYAGNRWPTTFEVYADGKGLEMVANVETLVR